MEVNPYAPPLEADPVREAPKPDGWEMREEQLWVKTEATLPMVDLYSGESAERMILMRIQLRRRIRWHIYLAFVALGSVVMQGVTARYLPTIVDLSILGLLLGAGMRAFSRKALIQVFLTKQTARRLRVQRIPALVMMGLAFAVAILAGWIDVVPWQRAQYETIVTGLVALMLLGAAVLWMRRPQLYYRGRSGDAFGVCGVHPEALGKLEQLRERR